MLSPQQSRMERLPKEVTSVPGGTAKAESDKHNGEK